ncbi:MAG: hypothetical protein D6776_07680, partial [Planctomycetota bacterium]
RLPGTGRYERRNVLRRTARSAYAQLVLDPDTARRLAARYYDGGEIAADDALAAIDGYLIEWAQRSRQRIAASGSEAFVPPSPTELLFMDDELLTPIVRLVQNPPHELADALAGLARAARGVGYELILYTYRVTGERFLILRASDAPAPAGVVARHGGTFIFRLGASRPLLLEVPYPVTDLYTFEAGARLLELLQARALLVAGASRYANADLSSDVARPHNPRSLFQLAHQVVVREGRGEIVTLQLRGFVAATPGGPDVVLSSGKPVRHEEQLGARLAELDEAFRQLRLVPRWYDGSVETLRFAGVRGPQWRFSEAIAPGTFVVCWLSREVRDRLRGHGFDPDPFLPELPPLGIPTERGNLVLQLVDELERWRARDAVATAGAVNPPAGGRAAAAVIEEIERYLHSGNVVHLAQALDDARRSGGSLRQLHDVSSARSYLLFRPAPNAVDAIFVANLYPRLPEDLDLVRTDRRLDAELTRFVREGLRTLRIRHPQTREGNR